MGTRRGTIVGLGVLVVAPAMAYVLLKVTRWQQDGRQPAWDNPLALLVIAALVLSLVAVLTLVLQERVGRRHRSASLPDTYAAEVRARAKARLEARRHHPQQP